MADVHTIDILAAAPEAGGFQPDVIRVAAGETVRLRFSVPDVTHGIAIGPGLGRDLGHVDPGEVQEVEVTFDQPGRHTYYCNSWCSPNHWRMRGTIEVYDPANPDVLIASEAPDPVLDALMARGVDIDAPHEAPVVPTEKASSQRGAGIVAQVGASLPAELADPTWRQTHSPADAWASLVEAGLNEAEAWDTVAYLWLGEMAPARVNAAVTLYEKNCAACHGETGDGQGPGAELLAEQGIGQHDGMDIAAQATTLDDPNKMLGGANDIYYAKLRRGGMGTGMPSFGQVFTREETWSLVDLLWAFVFDAQPLKSHRR